MPTNDTTPQQAPQASPQSMPNQPEGGVNAEKMLVQFLKELEQKVEDLSQRVDVLENSQSQNQSVT